MLVSLTSRVILKSALDLRFTSVFFYFIWKSVRSKISLLIYSQTFVVYVTMIIQYDFAESTFMAHCVHAVSRLRTVIYQELYFLCKNDAMFVDTTNDIASQCM